MFNSNEYYQTNLYHVEFITDSLKYLKFYNILDLDLNYTKTKRIIHFSYLDNLHTGLFNYDLVDELRYILLWFGEDRNDNETTGYSFLVKPNTYSIKMKLAHLDSSILKHNVSLQIKKIERIDNKRKYILSKKIDFNLED